MRMPRCSKCGKAVSIYECVSNDSSRKRYMVHYKCYHNPNDHVVFNVDKNTDIKMILKAFLARSKSPYREFSDVYL